MHALIPLRDRRAGETIDEPPLELARGRYAFVLLVEEPDVLKPGDLEVRVELEIPGTPTWPAPWNWSELVAFRTTEPGDYVARRDLTPTDAQSAFARVRVRYDCATATRFGVTCHRQEGA